MPHDWTKERCSIVDRDKWRRGSIYAHNNSMVAKQRHGTHKKHSQDSLPRHSAQIQPDTWSVGSSIVEETTGRDKAAGDSQATPGGSGRKLGRK